MQPTPAITKVSPSSGSIAGGTTVTITGSDFNAASEVKFGDLPAATYQVDSETQITATTPKSAKTGRVDITVKTIAGTSADGPLRLLHLRRLRRPEARVARR